MFLDKIYYNYNLFDFVELEFLIIFRIYYNWLEWGFGSYGGFLGHKFGIW